MRRIPLVLGLTGVAIAGVIAWRVLEPPAHADVATPPPLIPVQIASTTRGDLPVYLTGLGSVQAFNTVTVRSRVDGELQKVAFTEGQMVKPGDLLAQIDPRPFQAQLDQALAKRAQDAAQLTDAQINLKRFSDLATREFATRQSVDTQTALVHQLEAAIKGDDAAIENARVQLGYTTITAPLTGRTGIRLVDQGNIVHATDPGGLVVLTQLQPISVVFTLPESQLPGLRTAMQTAPVEAVAVSQDGAQVLDRGTIALVDNLIDQTTGTMKLKATFANAHETLWPGQFVKVRVRLRTDANVVTVPDDAIQHAPDGLYVYTVGPDGTVARRAISIGDGSDGRSAVVQGLSEGEHVVTAGQYRLQPGARVIPQAVPPSSPAVPSPATTQPGAAS